jgi:hypothetical protein
MSYQILKHQSFFDTMKSIGCAIMHAKPQQLANKNFCLYFLMVNREWIGQKGWGKGGYAYMFLYGGNRQQQVFVT